MVGKYSTQLNLSGLFAPAQKEMWTPSSATNKENMPFDVNQETITRPVSHFAAELNVKNLCGKQTTPLEELIVNPNGRIDWYCRQFFISRALTISTATQASPSCKPFADFVKKTLLEHLRTGAISLKGKISEVELTASVADYWTETEQCYDINTREAIALNKVLLSFADVHKDARVDAEIDNKALNFSWCNQGGRSVTLNRAI